MTISDLTRDPANSTGPDVAPRSFELMVEREGALETVKSTVEGDGRWVERRGGMENERELSSLAAQQHSQSRKPGR
ncbi:hypothetical protein PRK78_000430 [Emydomyces testavorans]|uniref:Uncharacterized protein n=1 Tax=Emydomyces testavorans TaxID=2070801 RepID=A0AAF0IFX3_9EURO|nr:hypothetical protein PRK78_000430 [Emydomyces testavorans]